MKQTNPILRSERFRITVAEPPYGGVNRSREIGTLLGNGLKPALSKEQMQERNIQINYNNAKL